MEKNRIYREDCLEGLRRLPDNCIDSCVTSPPYFRLRNYGDDRQIGLEDTPEEYIAKLVNVFKEVKRVLKDSGTVWINIGDSYNGSGKAGNNPEYMKRHTAFGKTCDPHRFGLPVKIPGLKDKDLIGIP